MSVSAIVGIALAFSVAAPADSLLAPADLRADLALLREAYTAMHPGLHRYATPAEVESRFDAVDVYFSSPRTMGQAFLAFTRLTASIKCGHSYPNFWNQSRAVQQALFEGQDKLPFEFRWLDGRMIVTADHSRERQLPRGTEIVAVDGTPARTILDSLVPLARADGSNDAKRVAYLEVQGRDEWFPFDALYPLVFPVRDTLFTLAVRAPGAAVRSVTVRALTLAERRTQGDAPVDLAPDAPVWSYSEQDGIGVLRMPTWAIYDSKWDAAKWTDSLMRDIAMRDVPELVIDLRGNEGGVDAGDRLLARLIDAPVTLPLYRSVVRYRSAPAALLPALDTWDRSFLDWGNAAVGPDATGNYRLVRWTADSSTGQTIRPEGPRYRGRVWVLVGAANSSATFQFALAVKRTGVATLVGQTTGGNRRGINGSAFVFLRLKRTGLEVDLPLVAGLPAGDEPDAGVEPDVLVRPTLEQLAAGVDAEMAAITRIIRRR